MNLADALTAKKFDDGSVIVKQGSNADGMYFIESGVVDVHVTGNDGTEKLVSRNCFSWNLSLSMTDQNARRRKLSLLSR